MARAKRESDRLYNARRRLRRQAERLRRDAEKQTSELMRSQMLSFAAELERTAKTSKEIRTVEQQKAERKRLKKVRERTVDASREQFSRVYRSNLIFQQQLNAAGTKGASSTISSRKKDVFWMATKGIWTSGENISRDRRYEMILEEFYLNPSGSNQKKFENWLRDEKGINPADVVGNLELVFEYVTEKLNDPSKYDDPEMPYENVGRVILTVK